MTSVFSSVSIVKYCDELFSGGVLDVKVVGVMGKTSLSLVLTIVINGKSPDHGRKFLV